MLEMRDGIARNMIPHTTPKMKELAPPAIRKHKPTPRLVKVSIDTTIALVDGKATLLIRL
jgi:hypothetical protein